jgi:Tol biopolymer transport system component
MTDDRSLERAARSWIESGPTRAPDRAVEAALLTIESTAQERDLRIPWRLPKMLMNRLAVVAAAVLVLVAGAFTFSRLTATPGTSATTPSPTLAPSPTALSIEAGYAHLPGWIVFEHFGPALDGSEPERNDFDRRQIWLVKADGTGLHELAPGKPAEDGKVAPDISPDGKTVVFASWGPLGRIWSVPIDGNDPTLLTTDCGGTETGCFERDPSYAPDGNRIAFVRDEHGGSNPSSVVGIRDLRAGTVSFIESTRVPLASAHLNQPTWSPDGRRLAYHLDTQGRKDDRPTKIRIWVVNTDGSGLAELPAPIGEAQAADPDWSPDGSLIAFSTMANREGEGTGGSLGIYTIRPDGTNLTRLCGPCLSGGIAPTWTPDGKHIMFFGFRTWALMDPDGRHAAAINPSKLTFNVGFYYFSELQPTS